MHSDKLFAEIKARLDQMEKNSRETMTLTTKGVAAASPYLKKLNEHIKVIVNEVMDDEDEEENGTNTSQMDGSTPKATKRTSRGQS